MASAANLAVPLEGTHIGPRQQLPPQIKRVELARRANGRPVVRYLLRVDVGEGDDGKRKQLKKRYATEKEARDALDEIRGDVAKGAYVHPSTLTVDKACEDWLVSRHKLKPTSAEGYAWILTPVRAELGHIPVQKLTRRDVDELVRKLRAGGALAARRLGRGRAEFGASCDHP